MLRIAKSLITIVAVLTIAAGATSAYFTDQEIIAGNTFSTGKLDIDIRGAGSSPQMLTNMAPGEWTNPIEYQIYNQNTPVSTIAAKYKFHAKKISQTEPGMYGLMNVVVRHTFAGTTNPGSWPIVWQGQLKDMDINSIDYAISDYIGVNITHVYYLEYQLDPSAGNEYQGDSVVFDLIFDATQSTNPGWNE